MDSFSTQQDKLRTYILSDEMCRIIIESNQVHDNEPIAQKNLIGNLEDLLKETNEEKIRRSILSNSEFRTAKFFLETCKNINVKRNNKYLLHCIGSFVPSREIPIEEIYDLIIDNFGKKRYFVIEICLEEWMNSFLPEQLYFFLKKLERLIDINELGGIDGSCIKNCCDLIISSEKISPNHRNGEIIELAIELGLNDALRLLISHPLSRLNQLSYICTDTHIPCNIRYGELKIAFYCDNIEAGEILMKKILTENPKMTIEQMMPVAVYGQCIHLENPIHWEEYQKSFRRFLVMCQNM